MPKISAVIPCYNEEASIAAVIKRLPAEVEEVIVVDNNCTDRTAARAEAAGAKVVSEAKPGYGAAIKRGLAEARGDLIAVLDGDGQYPPEEVAALADYLAGAGLDFVSANRFPLADKKVMTGWRRLGNRFLTFFANALFATRLEDSQSGFWLFRREVLEKVRPESDNMPFSEEIKLLVLQDTSLKFGECHVGYRPRQSPSKLIPFKHGWINFLYLLRLKRQSLGRDRRPLWFFLGAAFLTAALVFLAALHINYPFTPVTSDVNGLNGVAAINIASNGAFKMRFGLYESLTTAPTRGAFYTHHPAGFIWPTVLTYKLFGVSELTTRLGPLLFLVFGFWFFAYGLRKIFYPAIWTPLFIAGAFVILPGMIFYGETLELAVASLPAALISWSLFVSWSLRGDKVYAWLFWLSVVLGGLVGWFFYFLPAAIWLFALVCRRQPERKKLLVWLPLACLAALFLNLLHFLILNGNVFGNLAAAFSFRASHPPFWGWLSRLGQLFLLHYTWVFALLAAFGLAVFWRPRQGNQPYFWPLIIFPFLILAVFSQWSTHPFGVIFFAPLVAILAGGGSHHFLNWLGRQAGENFSSVLAGLVLIALALGFSLKNLDYFFNDFTIFSPNDVAALKALAPSVRDGEICLGQNDWGLGFNGIADWYLGKNVASSPACPDGNSRYALIFNPQFGPFYQAEYQNFLAHGFSWRGCSGYLCLLTLGQNQAVDPGSAGRPED